MTWFVVLIATIAGDALAERRTSRAAAKANLQKVCPAKKIQQINPNYFYKNNKPIRDTNRPDAPVVGSNPVMTLAGQVGRGPRLFTGGAKLFSTNGKLIAGLVPYPCAADHCTGRVVSSMHAGIARRAALKASRKPGGYIKIDSGVCVHIPDVGRCFGAGVNMGRPLCDRTLK